MDDTPTEPLPHLRDAHRPRLAASAREATPGVAGAGDRGRRGPGARVDRSGHGGVRAATTAAAVRRRARRGTTTPPARRRPPPRRPASARPTSPLPMSPPRCLQRRRKPPCRRPRLRPSPTTTAAGVNWSQATTRAGMASWNRATTAGPTVATEAAVVEAPPVMVERPAPPRQSSPSRASSSA